mmetsp:Transcript_63452/g.170526  ORF Transcript_63452/g.170526 Transcript_63452/m.170526 type:complete len:96 (-) Transcript_63452:7-294(-)
MGSGRRGRSRSVVILAAERSTPRLSDCIGLGHSAPALAVQAPPAPQCDSSVRGCGKRLLTLQRAGHERRPGSTSGGAGACSFVCNILGSATASMP